MIELQTTWERYVASWKAVSAAEKRELYQTCLHLDCVYRDPLNEAHGWEALAAYMLAFHSQIPGGHFVTTSFMAHHQRSLATWQMLSAVGSVLGEGSSYGEYDADHKVIAMTGFFVTPAAQENA